MRKANARAVAADERAAESEAQVSGSSGDQATALATAQAHARTAAQAAAAAEEKAVVLEGERSALQAELAALVWWIVCFLVSISLCYWCTASSSFRLSNSVGRALLLLNRLFLFFVAASFPLRCRLGSTRPRCKNCRLLTQRLSPIPKRLLMLSQRSTLEKCRVLGLQKQWCVKGAAML